MSLTLVRPDKDSWHCGTWLCIGLIFGLWTAYVLWLYPSVQSTDNNLLRLLIDGALRILIFIYPVWQCLKKEAQDPISYLRLHSNIATGVAWGFTIGTLQLLFNGARLMWLGQSNIHWEHATLAALISGFSVATVAEEITFRGFLLQRFTGAMGFWKADLIASGLFVAIHFPGWILASDTPLFPARIAPIIEIFLLGLLNGYLLRKTGSLWACIVVHAINNSTATLLYLLMDDK